MGFFLVLHLWIHGASTRLVHACLDADAPERMYVGVMPSSLTPLPPLLLLLLMLDQQQHLLNVFRGVGASKERSGGIK